MIYSMGGDTSSARNCWPRLPDGVTSGPGWLVVTHLDHWTSTCRAHVHAVFVEDLVENA